MISEREGEGEEEKEDDDDEENECPNDKIVLCCRYKRIGRVGDDSDKSEENGDLHRQLRDKLLAINIIYIYIYI